MRKRPPIPAEVRRRVLVEAGHRCAIPACRHPDIEIHHIDHRPQNNKYENLIALCPNCHFRAQKGQIDRKSLKIYKGDLQWITDRYNKFEISLLDDLRKRHQVVIAGNMLLFIKNLLDEKLVEARAGKKQLTEPFKEISPNIIEAGEPCKIEGVPFNIVVRLTKDGRKFIDDWNKGHEGLAW